MMFNEYMDHANQCAGFYSVTRKDEINLQQNETNRFKQKWVEVSGNNYPPPANQNSTPPPPLTQSQFNNTIKKEAHYKHPPQQPQHHPYMNQGQFQNNQNQYKASMQIKSSNQPNNLDNNQHMIMKHQQIQQASANQNTNGQITYQQKQSAKYYEKQQPQFIPNMKDNSNQHMIQSQKRQTPSPMIINNNGNMNNSNHNNYSLQQQPPQHTMKNNYENPSKKFGMQHSNSTNSNNNNNKPSGNLNKNNNSVNNTNNSSYGNQLKIYHHNSMQGNYSINPQQSHSNQVHQNMQHQNYKPSFSQHQQQPHPQSNYMQHQNYHSQQQQTKLHPNQPNQPKSYSAHEYNLDLKNAPRVNSPIHSNPSPYPQIHSNGPPDSTNTPNDTWVDSNKRDLVSPSLANNNGFNKKVSSSSLIQPYKPVNDLPIKSPVPPLRSTTPSMDTSKTLSDTNVQKSPVRMLTQSPSNSSLNTSICVPTPINNQNLIDLNQDQLIADDCDSGSLLSPLNVQKSENKLSSSNSTSNLNFQGSKSSILSEINIDELFMYYPKVFEELFYSFKLNSIEQIEHELRTYCEQQFKINFTSNNNKCSNSNSAQQFSIRI